MYQPLVSVIIPCYNCEKYVAQAVWSITNQTYTNVEILITDDCSTDGTYHLLESITETDARIQLFHNDKNLNIVCTLNNMIEKAKGVYIARMDADDISLPERIERQVQFLETHPDYGICGCSAWHIDAKGKNIGVSMLPCTNYDIQLFKVFASPFYHPTVMIRAGLLKKERYSSKALYAEDYELWLRLLTNTKAINIYQKLFCYRIVQMSISHNEKSRILQREKTEELRNKEKYFDSFINMHNFHAKISSSVVIMKSKKTADFINSPLYFSLLCICVGLFVLVHIKWRIIKYIRRHIR
ncbi:hypothetical protein FACS189461_1020 [Spirochaetia bacterium]|nr:hypothetical protein FACS189461_1020 [Spirochaetia bacterium]